MPPPIEAPASDPAVDSAASGETGELKPEDFELEGLEEPNDPLEPINRVSFKVFWTIDRFAIRPAAMVYRAVVPKPLRDGARNAMTNLSEPLVFANDVLQLRPKRALKSLGRFVINSIFGFAGLFDVAKRKPFNIEYHYNTLGSTLGYHGVKPGPYLYFPIGAPLTGPTTLRDVVDYAQGFIWPRPVGFPFDQGEYDLSTTVVGGLGDREANDAELKAMFSDAIDKYATFRANFLQNRQGEIEALKAKDGEALKGPEFDDPLANPDPGADPAPAAPLPADPVSAEPAPNAPQPADPLPGEPAAP